MNALELSPLTSRELFARVDRWRRSVAYLALEGYHESSEGGRLCFAETVEELRVLDRAEDQRLHAPWAARAAS